MSVTLTPAIKATIQCIIVSQNAVVGTVKGAGILIVKSLQEMVERNECPGIPSSLFEDTINDLKNNLPTEKVIKEWLLYTEDFSGYILYLTKSKDLSAGRIIRSLDLSGPYQYSDNREYVKDYTEAVASGDSERIKIAEDALTAQLPGKKLKYIHWIGSKPTKAQLTKLASECHYFDPKVIKQSEEEVSEFSK